MEKSVREGSDKVHIQYHLAKLKEIREGTEPSLVAYKMRLDESIRRGVAMLAEELRKTEVEFELAA